MFHTLIKHGILTSRGMCRVLSKTTTVIHLEIGSSESLDSLSQKAVGPSDKKVSPIQHFSSFPVQNLLLRSWLQS